MKVMLEITINRLGVPPDAALRILRDHLPEYVTGNGYTVLIESAKVLKTDVTRDR